MDSVDVKNMNVDGLKEKASVDLDSVKTSMDSVDVKNMNVDDVKSNATIVNKKMNIYENEFIIEKSLSMDYGLKEVDSVEDCDIKVTKRASMDSKDFNDININKEEWYHTKIESIKEERECKLFEWFKKCLNSHENN